MNWPTVLGGLAALYGAAWVWKGQTVRLRYFKPHEFGQWWPLMDEDLLRGLDEFRRRIGRPVQISPAIGALGRPGAGDSMHNVTKWGQVRAADVLIPGATVADLPGLVAEARAVGVFGGVGAYPDWEPWPGLHLDTRDRDPNQPATWAGLDDGDGDQYYTAIEEAWA
ncbi:hypothetical protein [Saccharospirillum salsuginis]|uniref:Peptidase M15 n=1 Tax=Saccharospirillum salsuginis TaxID=418750 RepID=A0A918K840_9GAMM|nr:hypothetical protein [Saccharospirillum salsuginis]GGX52355.1 hypothetical protein GCM10007392_19610 [Saccharospirillum salsuginis]